MASEFRDGDVVEVHAKGREGPFQTFQGVVDSQGKKGLATSKWVFVRKFGHTHAGGWYPSQCRRIARPKANPALPIPDNIILGEN